MTPRLAAVALFLASAPTAPSAHLRYRRVIQPASSGSTCTVLDSAVYAHASPRLSDLRLFTAANEAVPFALLINGNPDTEAAAASVLHLLPEGRGLRFDLAMPRRPYTDVVLALAAPHLLAQATVSAAGVPLGTFTLFDLTAEGLPAESTLHLQETTAPLLHVTLTPLAGGSRLTSQSLRGATVPPSREAQTLFTPVVSTHDLTQGPHQTTARLTLPAHVPVERVLFTLAPSGTREFRRPVRITSHPVAAASGLEEQIGGTISRLHRTIAGRELRMEQLAVPATLGANLQQPAIVDVVVDNGPEPPLPLATVSLETRQHELCFNSPGTAPLDLRYGGVAPPSDLPAGTPGLDLADVRRVALGPEQVDALYAPPADTRSLAGRHPRLFSLGSILAICFAGVTLLRSTRLRL